MFRTPSAWQVITPKGHETPRHAIIELNADGTNYLMRTDAAGVLIAQTWPEVHDILSSTSTKLSQQSMLEQWPSEETPPDRSTLSRWLKRATQQGLLCRSGTGLRGQSFLYWVPGREPLLWPGHHAKQKSKHGASAPRRIIAVCANKRDRGDMAALWFNANGVAC